ncbi:MAG: hypothetical protein NW223_24495 [Hyphomicrobiaceae bacterium]|nr:hypothetical protein [Hyphomicrobiaceae bacterium]
MAHAEKEIRRRGAVPERLEEDSEHGRALRREIGALTYEINVQQYAAAGLNFGCYYAASPIIAYDTTDFPPYTMSTFTPSTTPGCRLPHVVLPDGRSLYDLLGPGYTLLRTEPGIEAASFLSLARRARVPVDLLDLPAPAHPVYDRNLLLVRPDQTVAWRGDAMAPDLAARLLSLVTGTASTPLAAAGIADRAAPPGA